MSYDTERARLEEITPKSLPKNAAESGLGADLLQEKFYAGIFYLHDLLEAARQAYASADSELSSRIDTLQTALTQLTGRVATLEANPSYYAALANQVEILQTLVNSHTSSISSINSAITTITSNITTLRSDIVNGTISAYKAVRDGDGNIIKTTYATLAALGLTNTEITKIKNGETTVAKAASDDEGNVIKTTYVKKSDVVDALNDTSTNKPLSANQGKVLQGKIDTILELIASNDTDLDTVQEIVTYIKNNKSLIDGVTTNKVNVSDIVDNLTSQLANKPLSANQGYVLKALIDALSNTKANAADVYTKEEAGAVMDTKISGITGVNVITDKDEDKVFDHRLLIKGKKVYLAVTDISEIV